VKGASPGIQFLTELKLALHTPELWTDGGGAAGLSQTSKFLRRSRHIEHWYHYLRQQVQREQLTIQTLPGKDNPADILTKLTPMSMVSVWKDLWLGKTGEAG